MNKILLEGSIGLKYHKQNRHTKIKKNIGTMINICYATAAFNVHVLQ